MEQSPQLIESPRRRSFLEATLQTIGRPATAAALALAMFGSIGGEASAVELPTLPAAVSSPATPTTPNVGDGIDDLPTIPTTNAPSPKNPLPPPILDSNNPNITDLNVFGDGGRKIHPTAIILHDWGSDGNGKPDIRQLIGTLQSRRLSVQFGITKDGKIFLLTPSINSYAADAKCANPWSIGEEIQGSSDLDPKTRVTPAAEKASALLTRYLMQKFKIPQAHHWDSVHHQMIGVVSHKEVDPYCAGANGKPDVNDTVLGEIQHYITLIIQGKKLVVGVGTKAVSTAPPPDLPPLSDDIAPLPMLGSLTDGTQVGDLPPLSSAASNEAATLLVPAPSSSDDTQPSSLLPQDSIQNSIILDLPLIPGSGGLPKAPKESISIPTNAKNLPTSTLATLKKHAARFQELQPVYEEVAKQEGIPWQMLAAVHWREGGPNLSDQISTLAGEKLGTSNPDHGTVIRTFADGLHKSAQYLKNLSSSVYGVKITPTGVHDKGVSDITALAEVFDAYNRGAITKRNGHPATASPYAMNDYDKNRINMFWPSHDPVGHKRDGNVGAVPVYVFLGGPT